MTSRTRVDVVIADGTPEHGAEALTDVLTHPHETVDIAPDPNRRIIVIAPTKQAGQAHADALSIAPIAIVTPRSLHAARGMVADQIIEADGLNAEEREALTIEVAPTLATTD